MSSSVPKIGRLVEVRKANKVEGNSPETELPG